MSSHGRFCMLDVRSRTAAVYGWLGAQRAAFLHSNITVLRGLVKDIDNLWSLNFCIQIAQVFIKILAEGRPELLFRF